MKNINKKIAGFILTSLLVFTACDTNLDINKDPDLLSPVDLPMSGELPAAETGIAGAQGSYAALLGGFYSQYWTQSAVANQYKTIDDYSTTSSSGVITGYWGAMYDALTDVRNIKANALNQQNWNYYLIATVLNVQASQYLVDAFGSIPYKESNNPAILAPKFEEASQVYDEMVADLKDALSKDLSASPLDNAPGNTDFLFSGDMTKWTQYANTLLLKLYLRQSTARPTVAQTGITALINSGAQFLSSDAAITQFKNEDSRSNPLYESDRRQLNVGTNLRASFTLGSYLKDNLDTRLDMFYTGTTFQLQGDYNNGSATSSVVILNATDPVYFISTAESKFLQAEADVRYMGGTKAKTLYDAGVLAAFNQFGLDGSSFVSGAYAYPNGTMAENIEAIITQKWIASFPGNGIEAFFERNRTGYPKISSIPQNDPNYVSGEIVYPITGKTGGLFVKRLPYPQTEMQRNTNAPQTIIPITDPVWFDLNY